jgi:hypothetical protein
MVKRMRTKTPPEFGSLGVTNFTHHTSTKGNMKTKCLAGITAVVLAAAATLFAIEKQAAISPPKLIHLKSNGATIAELKLPKGATFEFTSTESTHAAGRITAKGGVTIQIKHAGGSAVTVKAELCSMCGAIRRQRRIPPRPAAAECSDEDDLCSAAGLATCGAGTRCSNT